MVQTDTRRGYLKLLIGIIKTCIGIIQMRIATRQMCIVIDSGKPACAGRADKGGYHENNGSGYGIRIWFCIRT